MRRTYPLIVGAGPAGCAAAITLAAAGRPAMTIERSASVGDALCGGFLSWRTLAALGRLGVGMDDLRGHPIGRVRIFAGDRSAEAALPEGAIGVSRHRLDTVMCARAAALGTVIERGVEARAIEGDRVRLADGSDLAGDGLFVATGKHDVRGIVRPRPDRDPALGLRLRLPAHPALTAMIGDAIELHLFDRGYAGLVLQEDGSANLCLAVRKSRLNEAGGHPAALLAELGASPPLAARLAHADGVMVDAVGAVPYGWRATATTPGVFRLGDQAAVIPSLAGEGIGIAVASGISAAQAWLTGGPGAATAHQHVFARRAARPIGVASMLWRLAERPVAARIGTGAIGMAPWLAGIAARLTRIGD